MTLRTLSLLTSLALSACAAPPLPPPDTPVANAPPDTPVASPPSTGEPDAPSHPQCAPTQFVAAGACFDESDAACASLSCPNGCAILETAPAQVICSSDVEE
jgi:hypothetical protein